MRNHKDDKKDKGDNKDFPSSKPKKGLGLGGRIIRSMIISAIIPGGDIFLGE